MHSRHEIPSYSRGSQLRVGTNLKYQYGEAQDLQDVTQCSNRRGQQALETYFELDHNPNIIGRFREARLDLTDYIQHDQSQVDQLVEVINKSPKDDS